MWLGLGERGFAGEKKLYVVQTAAEAIERCILMTSDPGDLVFDPTCGSGTTAFAAEKWGRRWITCDTSRVAITLAKQRLMTSIYSYYELVDPEEGISSGFRYSVIPHIRPGTIAYNRPPEQEILYDRPQIDKSIIRISGTFTVEAVPSLAVRSLDHESSTITDSAIGREAETIRQEEWRNEILHSGIRGKDGQKLEFSRVELFQGTKWLHCDAEIKEQHRRTVISFGPAYHPLDQRQVELAIEEAFTLVPKPNVIVFAAFQFDPEAAKYIDELRWPSLTTLKVQMNTDLLTDDLKKERSSNESFWLIGQPDISLAKQQDDQYVVEVHGFDYYNTRNGQIESGDISKIAMWMLDPDYDGRSLYPQQIFFPTEGGAAAWEKISKILKARIDEDLVSKYSGSVSLPFSVGKNKRAGVKIIDDRGIESLKILDIE